MSEDNRIPEIRVVLVDFGQLGEPGRQNQTTALEALERIDAILDSAPPAPRVFFPGDTVPRDVRIMDERGVILTHVGRDWRYLAMNTEGPAVEISVPTPEEWQAAVDRAKTARADAEWQHTEGINP